MSKEINTRQCRWTVLTTYRCHCHSTRAINKLRGTYLMLLVDLTRKCCLDHETTAVADRRSDTCSTLSGHRSLSSGRAKIHDSYNTLKYVSDLHVSIERESIRQKFFFYAFSPTTFRKYLLNVGKQTAADYSQWSYRPILRHFTTFTASSNIHFVFYVFCLFFSLHHCMISSMFFCTFQSSQVFVFTL